MKNKTKSRNGTVILVLVKQTACQDHLFMTERNDGDFGQGGRTVCREGYFLSSVNICRNFGSSSTLCN